MDPMEYIVPNRKRLPYGMMNFAVIRREDYYYVDKTRFIPMIEQADRFFFFIRPRRFGKSLTLNILQHYYDWTKRTGLSTNWTIWFRSANVPDRKCISSSTNTTTSPTPSFPMRKACTATLMKRMAKVICVLSSIR